MPVFLQYILLFVIGGVGYGLLETLCRGFTHWTMLLTGGACFSLMYRICTRFCEPKWKKWIMCGVAITAVEFVTGGIVNVLMKWNVWDYSSHKLNLMGQICFLFSLLWVLVSIPATELCLYLQKHLFCAKMKKK